jgi:sulfur-oxidizing protein SoxY
MSMKRRTFLQGAVACSTIGIAVGAGLLAPRTLLAAWPKAAFAAKSPDMAISALLGPGGATESAEVDLKVKTEGEINPSSLPVKVSTKLPAESITIIAEKNPIPLVAVYELTPAVEAYVSTKIKFAESSNVIAVVKADGKLYSAKQFVEVTEEGCAA